MRKSPVSCNVLWPCAWNLHLISHSPGGENQVDSWFGWVTLWNVLERMIQGNTYSQWLLQRLRWALILTHRSEHPEFLNLWGIWVGNDLCEFSPRRLRTVVSPGMGFSETRVETQQRTADEKIPNAFAESFLFLQKLSTLTFSKRTWRSLPSG